MIDENSPEMLKLLAPYHDSIGRFNRRVADMTAEFEEAQAKRLGDYRETTEKQQAELAKIQAVRAELKTKFEEQRKAEEADKPNTLDAWGQPRPQESTDLRFGPEDDEPWRPAGPPPGPPPAPAPSRPRRPVARDDDDDDMSGQSWLR
jgi:hypothetical protein